jgi:regulatory protein
MDLLARREHSVQELARKLAVRGYADEEIYPALEALVDRDYLSDVRYAEAYVRSRIAKGFGEIRIRQELRERGIDRELSDATLATADVDWFVCIADVVRKKYGDLTPVNRVQSRNFLAYRGFPHDLISRILHD